MSKPDNKWTLVNALPLCRDLELHMASLGFHIALGGSVLYAGVSDKDLDIFVYPHSHTTPQDDWRKNAANALHSFFGTQPALILSSQAEQVDFRYILSVEHAGKRIDLFLVS